MLNMFRMLIRPSSGACDLFVELFHGMYCSGTMLVGVTLWLGWGGAATNKSQAPEDGSINIRNMLIIKQGNKKASDINFVSLYSTIKSSFKLQWAK